MSRSMHGSGFLSSLKKKANEALKSQAAQDAMAQARLYGQDQMAQAKQYAMQTAQEQLNSRGIPVDVAAVAESLSGQGFKSKAIARMKRAIGMGFGNRVRKAHQIKGSLAAKTHMANLRAMRRKH